MASENIDINVNVNSAPAVTNLNKVEKSVQTLQASFLNLKNALVGFALGGFVQGTLQMADSVSDLGKATGISTQQILGFAAAIKQNGGDAEGAYRAIERFALSLEEARNGSRDAQDAFQDAGLTLKEISNLDVGPAFQAYLKGLAEIEGETKRLSNANNILGKSVRTVDFEGVANDLGKFTLKAAQQAVEVERVGEMVDNLQKAYGDLQKVLITVLQPIANFINWLSEGGKAAQAFLDVLLAIGLVLIGGPIVNGFKLVIALIQKLVTTSTGLTVLGTAIGAVTTKLLDFFGVIDLDKFREFLGLQTNAQAAAEKQAAAEAKLKEELEKARKEAEQKALKIKTAAALLENTTNKQIDATRRSIQQYNEQFDLQTKLLGQTEEQKIAVTTLYDLQQRKIAALLPLQEKLRDLLAVPKEARSATDTQEIGQVQRAIADVTKQYDSQVPIVKKLVDERIRAMQIEKDLAHYAELAIKATEAQLAAQEAAGEIQISAMDKVRAMYQEHAQSTLPGVQAELQKIADKENEIAIAAKRRVAEQFNDNPQGLAQALANIDAATKQAITIQQDAAKAIYETQRSFEFGWTQAFNSYLDNATNSARKAGEIFSSVTRNMESAIDKFVETGKFSFKDFARSIIQDMLKIELKAAASKILSGIFGGGGGSFLGSLFGFANGGTPPINKPSIVGERGPELFIPKTPGTIVPNEMLGGTKEISAPVTNNYYTYNIDAIDSRSVAQFFAENRRTMLGTIQLAQKELPYFNK